ncbi:MAG: glycosyltransferase family 4 protein [Planctomycetaceae bacterium]|nr:glycosyltransferase family 4 protein [Planctomycetaceae bacterium]
MKVAHIITRLIIGGAQENTLFNCEDLIRNFGDEVILITGPTTGPEGTLMNRCAGVVPTVVIPALIRPISPFHDVLAYRHIKRVLRDFKPDVVHTHSAKAGIIGRAVARKINCRCIVHTVHGAPFYPEQNAAVRWFYQYCERWAAKRCDALISVADAMTVLMVNANIAEREKFTTIYSGMDIEPFLNSASLRQETRAKMGFADSDVVVGKIARLFNLKGHEFVINAARSIIARIPNVKFLFVGDGTLADTHRRKIQQLGLEKYFVFTGLVSPERIPAMLSAMDIVVHTSLREGLARVLPQALLSGKPVISYDVDGAREVVRNNETGFLLPPKQIELLADAVVTLALNEDLRNKMGETGREMCRNKFDRTLMTERIRELYQRFI